MRKPSSLLINNKKLLLFIGCFFIIDYFFKGYISITDKTSNHFILFFSEYLNIVKWYRDLLLHGTRFFVEGLGYTTRIHDNFYIQINNWNQVVIVYSCLGFGVISFWTAFIISNTGNLKYKLFWLFGGIVALTFLNIIRISLLLISNYRSFANVIPFDHHTMFNVLSYLLIFLLIWRYIKSQDKHIKSSSN